LTACLSGLAQTADYFRSTQNPLYWKNRKPFEGYWQQDVHYALKATVDEKTDIIHGSEELTYWNNSPDTLTFVYFHLYQNAFQPGSYTDKLHKANNFPVRYGKYERQGLGTKVNKITLNGADLKTELDNTILKVFLPSPLKPGESVLLNLDFDTYFDPGGNIRRRMKMFNAYGFKHYDGVHWYPRISVYDRKQGWDTDQHLTKEFYGDFGSFDVELSFANDFVVEATGLLQNEAEVMPKALRDSLDIKRFMGKAWESPVQFFIKPDGTRKSWKFHADNVHDFAFTADPTYRIGEVKWNGILIRALAQEPHAGRWQTAAEFTASVIRTYSEDFGPYGYPKMVVCDAQDGMEYPMLTLDGGFSPDFHALIAHEVGHNWFFGMVGSNETYRAMMDEGFTQFIDSWACLKLDGPTEPSLMVPKYAYTRKFLKPTNTLNAEVYNHYMFDAVRGDETTLNTHSDHFNSALRHGGGYGQVYGKTATMLWNLQYVLGEELFLKCMKHYFSQWKFCHPYPEDFRNSVIQFAHVDLNWFFDEWIETAFTIDYAVKGVSRGKNPNEYIVTISRKGRMQMPVDFTVYSMDGKSYSYYIPNTWFEKKTSATILPHWIGWDKLQPDYQAHVTIPGGIKDVVIDTSGRLADVNMLNNSLKMPVSYNFDSKVYNVPDWKQYELFYRPDVWFNGYDGLKVGAHMNGNYMNYRHIFDANVWLNTLLFQQPLPPGSDKIKVDFISYRLNYKTATDKFVKRSDFIFSSRFLDGLVSNTFGFEFRDKSQKTQWYVNFKSMIRPEKSSLTYLLYPGEWIYNEFNNTINIGVNHSYNYRHGSGTVSLALRSSSLGSDYDFSTIQLTQINRHDLGRKFKFSTRLFMQAGTGSNIPAESSLYLAGASPEEMMDNKFVRSTGFVPTDWTGYGANTNHFQYGGGLNLRGYAGYLAPRLMSDGTERDVYKGLSGISASAELEFQKLFSGIVTAGHGRLHRMIGKINNTISIQTYLFGDAGSLGYTRNGEQFMLDDLRADAGIGTALTIKRWGALQTVSPLTIRFDIPLFLNATPAASPDYVQFRWVVGISRSF
ncbi:MAG TPA: M1 family aminopeptidase, partial [Bacteroidia bacterium]|nr:M1 family aminopeptidase [Bacteroidia bacterium]